MKDIFDREIKDGDFVIVKPTGRDSHGLHLGVIVGSNVMLRRGRLDPYITRYDQYYLVENPTQLEIDYINKMKQDYQKSLEEKEKEKSERKSKPTIKKKDMVVGKSYDRRGMYIGRVEVLESSYGFDEGVYDNCFVEYFTYDENRFNINTYQTVHGIELRSLFSSTKSFPKIYEVTATPKCVNIDSLVDMMRFKKEAINSAPIYISRIPKLKLLDLGVEI